MSESPQPVTPEEEESLCLYALNLMPEEERAALEAQLAAEPALRRSMRDFQGTLDGWVQSLPQRPAPLHVWGRIAATIRAAEAPVFATRTAAAERHGWTWGWQALGAAACVCIGMGLQAWWGSSPKHPAEIGRTAVQTPLSGWADGRGAAVLPGASPASEPATPAGLPLPGRESRPDPGAASAVATAGKGTPPRSATLETPRERVLQSQVTVLTELLNRELGTLPGASKLQVVRLLGPGEAGDAASLPVLDSNMLAALALSLLNQQQKSAATGVSMNAGNAAGNGAVLTSDHAGGSLGTATPPPSTTGNPSSQAGVSVAATGLNLASVSSDTGLSATSATASAKSLGATSVASGGGSSEGLASDRRSLISVTVSPVGNATPARAGEFNAGVVAFAPVPSGSSVNSLLASGTGTSTGAPGGPTGVMLILPQESAGTAVISNPTPLSSAEVYQFWQTDPATGTTVSLGTAHSDAATAIFNFSLPQGRSANSSVFITREPAGGAAAPTGPVVVSTPNPTTPPKP